MVKSDLAFEISLSPLTLPKFRILCGWQTTLADESLSSLFMKKNRSMTDMENERAPELAARLLPQIICGRESFLSLRSFEQQFDFTRRRAEGGRRQSRYF